MIVPVVIDSIFLKLSQHFASSLMEFFNNLGFFYNRKILEKRDYQNIEYSDCFRLINKHKYNRFYKSIFQELV